MNFQKEKNSLKMSLITKTTNFYDDYRVLETSLGSGTNGIVRECIHKQTQTKFAVKTLRNNPNTRRTVEIQRKASEKCQYVLRIVDVYENTIEETSLLIVVMPM
jgi:hypothetical protein